MNDRSSRVYPLFESGLDGFKSPLPHGSSRHDLALWGVLLSVKVREGFRPFS